jgi:hypothetical protein
MVVQLHVATAVRPVLEAGSDKTSALHTIGSLPVALMAAKAVPGDSFHVRQGRRHGCLVALTDLFCHNWRPEPVDHRYRLGR